MQTIDEYSVATVSLEMFFGGTPLSTGTAFLWDAGGEIFLITNWHNLSGKNPGTGRHLSPTGAEPDRVRILWNAKAKLGARILHEHMIRDAKGPLWLVHPTLQQAADVVALPLAVPTNAEPFPINKMRSEPLSVGVGQDVFVLGYPFAIGPGGLPIWKRGSIASEPEVLGSGAPQILIDTASRPGMSGSPVIRRSWGMAQFENGDISMGAGTSTKLVGVYSGRIQAADPLDAQLGVMWPASLIPEIIAGGTRDA